MALADVGRRARALSHHLHGPQALTRAMIICIAAGLVWQFVLTMALVAREQRTLRWSMVRDVALAALAAQPEAPAASAESCGSSSSR